MPIPWAKRSPAAKERRNAQKRLNRALAPAPEDTRTLDELVAEQRREMEEADRLKYWPRPGGQVRALSIDYPEFTEDCDPWADPTFDEAVG